MKFRKTLFILLIAAILVFSLSACTGTGAVTSWPGLNADADHAYLSYASFVIAVRLSDGAEAWRFPAKADTAKSFFASPTFAPDGSILIGDYANVLFNLDQKSGTMKWEFGDTKGKWVGPPLVAGDTIYAPSADRNLYALTLELKRKWAFPTQQSNWAQPAFEDGKLFVTSLDHHLYQVNPADGKMVWKVDMGAAIVSSPVLGSDSIYIGTLGKEMVAVDKSTGAIRWRKATEDTIWGTPLLIENVLYFGDFSGTIYALNAADGSVAWQLKPKGPIVASPVQFDNGIVFATEDGAVLLLEKNSNIRWAKTFEGKIYTTPVVAGERLLVGFAGADKLLLLVDKSGTEIWSFSPAKK